MAMREREREREREMATRSITSDTCIVGDADRAFSVVGDGGNLSCTTRPVSTYTHTVVQTFPDVRSGFQHRPSGTRYHEQF